VLIPVDIRLLDREVYVRTRVTNAAVKPLVSGMRKSGQEMLIGRDPVFGTIKSAVELIEKWPTVGDRLYFVAGSLASLVAIVAIAEDERPSELMGELSDAIGVRPVARWLGTDAPPFLASQSLAVQEACLSGVSAFVAIMIVGTVTRAPFYPDPIYDVPRLVGSRATATTWILILVAAQQGSVRPVLDGLRHVAAQAVWWCIGTALVVGLLAFILHRFRLADVLAPLLGPIAGPDSCHFLTWGRVAGL